MYAAAELNFHIVEGGGGVADLELVHDLEGDLLLPQRTHRGARARSGTDKQLTRQVQCAKLLSAALGLASSQRTHPLATSSKRWTFNRCGSTTPFHSVKNSLFKKHNTTGMIPPKKS
jgi:hypothetical protein